MFKNGGGEICKNGKGVKRGMRHNLWLSNLKLVWPKQSLSLSVLDLVH